MKKGNSYHIPGVPNNIPPTPDRIGQYEGVVDGKHQFLLLAMQIGDVWYRPDEAAVHQKDLGARKKGYCPVIRRVRWPSGASLVSSTFMDDLETYFNDADDPVVEPTPSQSTGGWKGHDEYVLGNVVRIVNKLLARTGVTVEQLFDALI